MSMELFVDSQAHQPVAHQQVLLLERVQLMSAIPPLVRSLCTLADWTITGATTARFMTPHQWRLVLTYVLLSLNACS